MLDFYEAGLTLKPSEKPHEKIAEEQLGRLKSLHTKLAEQYLSRLKQLSAEIDFKDDVELTDLEDSKHLFKPLSGKCSVTQIAIRRSRPLDGEKRFVIRKDLWAKLSETDRAGLLVHEIVYEHVSKLGEEDSRKARRLTALLFSPDLTHERFWKFIREAKLPIYP